MTLMARYRPPAKAAGQYVKSFITGRRIPLYAGLLITPRCNLKCVYCFPDSPHRHAEKELPLNEIFRIVDELYDLGTRYMALLGGEPLMRDDFGDIISHIARKNIIIEVITNGYFTRQKLNDLKKAGYVCHSIDGDEAAMTRNRGRGSFKKIMESLDLCSRAGIPVQLRTVFNKNNADQLNFLLDLARRYKTTLGLCEQAVIRERDNDYALSPQALQSFWISVRAYKKQGYPVDKTYPMLDNIIASSPVMPLNKIFYQNDPLPAGIRFRPCRINRGHVFIDSTGVMYPCAMLLGRGQAGRSIFGPGGIAEAWRGLADNDCLVCRQSIQDLKNEFFSFDVRAVKTVTGTIVSKIIRGSRL